MMSSQRAGEVTLSACPGDETNNDTCCSGGASFLKVNFGGASSGVVYLNHTLVPDVGCRTSMSIPGAEMGSSTELRFIDSDDDCLLDSFDDVACTSSSDSVVVIQGQALCFGVWNKSRLQLSYREAMPKNTKIYFVSHESDDTLQSTSISTSCSSPLSSPFAAAFTSECNPVEGIVIHLETDLITTSQVYLEFIDGVSTNYFLASSKGKIRYNGQ